MKNESKNLQSEPLTEMEN